MKDIRKGTRWGGEGVKIGTGKGGGGNSTVFMPATLWSQQKKKAVRVRDQGEGVKKKVVEQSHAQKNKEHASEEVRRF